MHLDPLLVTDIAMKTVDKMFSDMDERFDIMLDGVDKEAREHWRQKWITLVVREIMDGTRSLPPAGWFGI